MDSNQDIGASTEPTVDPSYWSQAIEVLRGELSAHKGQVSTIKLRRELENRLVIDEESARHIVIAIQFYNGDSPAYQNLEAPDFEYYHQGRSFVTAERWQELNSQLEQEAETEASEAAASDEGIEQESVESRKSNRSEEARLVSYVKNALEGVYDSDHIPDGRPYVFDVHNQRSGNKHENIDLLAVSWRSQQHVEIVSVESKLAFTPEAANQAVNYRRFCHRVWIAIPVTSDASRAAQELQAIDALLFDYVIDSGIGILACHRRQGGKYEVYPIHWPRRTEVNPVEIDRLKARYRDPLEKAGVVRTEARRPFPQI